MRALGKCLVLIGIIAVSQTALSGSKDVTVFDVRSTFKMADNQPSQKDYYINGGKEVGLVTGLIIDVTRLHALYDAYQNKSPGDLIVKVGSLEIIHSQQGLSVARLVDMATEKERPILEDEFIMIGDRVDLNSARKKKVANEAPKRADPVPAPVEPAAEKTTEFSSIAPIETPIMQ